MNLTGSRRPTLSVDRKSMLSHASSWIRSTSIEQARSIDDASGLSFAFLWELPEELAEVLAGRLTELDVYLPVLVPGYTAKLDKFVRGQIE